MSPDKQSGTCFDWFNLTQTGLPEWPC